MKRDKKEKIALQIVALENNARLGKNIKEVQNKIEKIMSTLSIEEILEIDDYIISNNLLTK